MSILDRLKKNTPAAADNSDAKKTAPAAATAKKGTKKADAKKATGAVHHGVLLRPVITEKATLTGTYVFEVAPDANKVTIHNAIQANYGVRPTHVRIINVKGKTVRWGQREGKRKDWKKAIVRLPQGKTITVYQGT